MAMTKCKECSNEISTKADQCPKCGAKQKRSIVWPLIIAFVVIGLLGNLLEPKKTEQSGRSVDAPQSNADPSVAAVESFVISPNGLNCKQVAQLAKQVASIRETGAGQDAIRGIVGGEDPIVDAVINDVYTMKLSQDRARMHVMELCIVKMQQGRR